MGSPRLVEQPPLQWRSARRPPRSFGLQRFRIQVSKDLLDDLGIFSARDDPHRPAAGRAGLDLDTEDPFEALQSAHRGAPFGGCRLPWILPRFMLTTPATLSWCYPRPVVAVRRKDSLKASEVDSRFEHQGAQPAMQFGASRLRIRSAVNARPLHVQCKTLGGEVNDRFMVHSRPRRPRCLCPDLAVCFHSGDSWDRGLAPAADDPLRT